MKTKKILKAVGWTMLSLVAICLLSVILIKTVFRDQAVAYLMKQLEVERLEVLRATPPYDNNRTDIRYRINCNAMKADSIYRYFRLDTLLNPEASTWQNTVTLADFVYRHIPHANSCQVPQSQRNAIGLWQYHQSTGNNLHCYYHSVLLQEILLAAHITNRYIRCSPQDSTDTDCHVVNHVWLPELQKWAMIDSDQGAYLTNEEGIPLSLEEMRRYAIEDKPMHPHFFRPDYYRDDYLSYWTKNLYWFGCYETTEFDQQTRRQERYVVLLPKGFSGFNLDNKQTVVTHNSDEFWDSPIPEPAY